MTSVVLTVKATVLSALSEPVPFKIPAPDVAMEETVGARVSIVKVPVGLIGALSAVKALPAASLRVPVMPVTVRSVSLLWPLATL